MFPGLSDDSSNFSQFRPHPFLQRDEVNYLGQCSIFFNLFIFRLVTLAHNIRHGSAVFRFAVHNSLSGSVAVVPVPLVLVSAYECVERTSQMISRQILSENADETVLA